jgi:hypothetical protein
MELFCVLLGVKSVREILRGVMLEGKLQTARFGALLCFRYAKGYL